MSDRESRVSYRAILSRTCDAVKLVHGCDVGESCQFPVDWRGKYVQSGLGEVIIAETHVSAKGTCVYRSGDYYLVVSR